MSALPSGRPFLGSDSQHELAADAETIAAFDLPVRGQAHGDQPGAEEWHSSRRRNGVAAPLMWPDALELSETGRSQTFEVRKGVRTALRHLPATVFS